MIMHWRSIKLTWPIDQVKLYKAAVQRGTLTSEIRKNRGGVNHADIPGAHDQCSVIRNQQLSDICACVC